MLTIIQVGHNDASDRYIRNKVKAITEAGMEAEVINIDENCSTQYVIDVINREKNKWRCRAIMVQLPLPDHLDKDRILRSIPEYMDIDGLNPISKYQPLTPCAIMRWLRENGVDLLGKPVTVLGRSELVGKPLANMLIDAGATVTVCNSRTPPTLKHCHCCISDIVISAVGKHWAIDEMDVRGSGGQIFIDVGINRNHNGTLCGDISEYAKQEITDAGSVYTPVPGGVGKWTVQELVMRLQKMESNHADDL